MSTINRFGTATVDIDGARLLLRGDLEIAPALIERKSVTGMDGVHGFSEAYRAPSIKMTCSDTDQTAIAALQSSFNVTVRTEQLNGKVYVLRNAVCTGIVSLNTQEGSYAITFEGMGIEELLAQAA
jgi:Phage tail tube protein